VFTVHDFPLFPERLKQLRLSLSLTQKQLAEEVGASERGIQNYEMGVRLVDTRTLVKLRNYFNVSADYLLGLSDDHPSATPHELIKLAKANPDIAFVITDAEALLIEKFRRLDAVKRKAVEELMEV
jgi:transcriptional regulator with XRE-family HTH domain